MNAQNHPRAIWLCIRGARCILPIVLAFLTPQIASADEIRLKDGKKLYGVIVSYDENMFKVKTDFGYVLVEKDKIASIVPSTAAEETKKDSGATVKKESTNKSAAQNAQLEPAVAPDSITAPLLQETSARPAAVNGSKPIVKIGNAAVHPSLPVNVPASVAAAGPALGSTSPATTSALAAPPAAPTPPKEESPANREEIQGNLYRNLTYGFHMYKAPSWNVLEDARSSLPNAIVALGTNDESTLMVVGREKSKETLDATAKAVEGRLREVYEDYRLLSQHKSTVGGLRAQEFQYRGKAEGHIWSGTLVVLSHGNDIFTVLGMTYADTDLIQIQENVIARAIASLNFDAH